MMNKRLSNTFKGIKLFYPFVFFCTVVFFFGCKNDELVGLEVQPDDTEIGLNTLDTFTIHAHTVRDDSVPTSVFPTVLLGTVEDPLFGTSRASLYTNFRLEQEAPEFANAGNLELDSAVLSFRILDSFFKSDQPELVNQHFRVFQLNDALLDDETYYSNFALPSGLTQIADDSDVRMRVQETDSVTVLGQQEPPQVRIKLDSAYMEGILNAGAEVYSNNESFQEFFKGVVVVPESNLMPGEGAIVTAGVLSSFSRLTLYFKNENDSTETFDFVINELCQYFNGFNHDYSGTTVGTALSDTLMGEEALYIQSLEGTAARLRIPSLSNWQNQPVLINQAMLIVTKDEATSATYDTHNRMLVLVDSLGKRTFPIDFGEGNSHFDGEFNETTNQYEINITRHVQRVMLDAQDGIDSNFDLLLVGSNSGSQMRRTVINGTNPLNGTRLKLRITYTPL